MMYHEKPHVCYDCVMQRPRRNRKSVFIRDLVRQNKVTIDDLIAPLFVVEGSKREDPIDSMPGQVRRTIDLLVEEVKELYDLGIKCVALFPCIEKKAQKQWCNGSYPSRWIDLSSDKGGEESMSIDIGDE